MSQTVSLPTGKMDNMTVGYIIFIDKYQKILIKHKMATYENG